MPTKFVYQAINENGRKISGEIDAENAEMANNILSEKGLIPSSVTKKGAGGNTSGESFSDRINEKLAKVKTEDIILFSKQFRTMIKAGVPIVQIFQIMENQTENLKLRKVIGKMMQDIKEGSSLYEIFKKHPNIFSTLYCSMIQAGEVSGALPEVLDRLIYIIDHEHKVQSDIKSALRYPMIVSIFLGVAFMVLLNFVIPKFAGIFTKTNMKLPLPTQICMSMNQFMQTYWYIILAIVVGCIVSLVLYLKTEQGKYVRDVSMMKVPLIGPLIKKSAMSRFASIFAILQSSGVAILDSMKILSGAINNTAMSREFGRIQGLLEEGRGIAGPLRSSKYFTPMVVNMVAIGEESGNLDEMLSEVSKHYDTEVEYSISKLSEAIGPLLTVGLAVVIGFFALAIFLPMWDLTKMANQ